MRGWRPSAQRGPETEEVRETGAEMGKTRDAGEGGRHSGAGRDGGGAADERGACWGGHKR